MEYAKIINEQQYQKYCKKHLELGKRLAATDGDEHTENEYHVLDLIIEDYHNGRIKVLSSEIGKGTTVQIALKQL